MNYEPDSRYDTNNDDLITVQNNLRRQAAAKKQSQAKTEQVIPVQTKSA